MYLHSGSWAPSCLSLDLFFLFLRRSFGCLSWPFELWFFRNALLRILGLRVGVVSCGAHASICWLLFCLFYGVSLLGACFCLSLTFL